MGKGRKPISNALKVLKGTDQPCRMREEISYEKITKIPKAPDYMCIAGKKVYKITAQQLADQGILNVVNINAVMMYANEMGTFAIESVTKFINGRDELTPQTWAAFQKRLKEDFHLQERLDIFKAQYERLQNS